MLQFYNTLSRRMEDFRPLAEGRVGMYTCGPTVYDYAHVGNLRYFTFVDVLRRTLLRRGFQLTHVMNLTDVEDKIIAGMARTGKDLAAYTQPYIDAFFESLRLLRIQRAEITPTATDHIDEIVRLIETLRENGHTYEKDGSIYYRIRSFGEYGKLSGVNLDETRVGDRVDHDEYEKENVRDFVLWKAHKEGEPFWDTRIGKGRPGWHIECSAMAMEYLGAELDIHCGGEDLIFPHHENEIAQSEGASGKPFVNYWLHARHLLVNGQKMSKSLGNFYTLPDLIRKGHHPLAIRLFFLRSHYRDPLNLLEEALAGNAEARERVLSCYRRLDEMQAPGEAPTLLEQAEAQRARFEEALDHDLDTPNAVAAVFDLVRLANQAMADGALPRDTARKLKAMLDDMDAVLALLPEAAAGDDAEIDRRVQERTDARKRRDFAAADAIRDQLASRGIILEDTPKGVRWYRKD